MKAMKAMKVMKKKAAMKVMKKKVVSGKAMTAGAVAVALGGKPAKEVLSKLVTLAAAEVKKSGKFTIPGVAVLKLKHKAARPATTRMMFGKMTKVKAKKASKVVKAFAAKKFKDACL